ncbi:TipA [Balamuthia mandrillaris]
MKRKTSSRKKAKSKGKAPPPQLLPTTTTATTTTTTTHHSHPSSQQRPQSGSARNSLLIPFNSLLEEHKRERSSSVVAFPVGPYKEWVRLPEIKVKGLDNASAKGREEKAQQQPQRQPVLVCGPKDDLSHTLETFQDVAAGQSISTYPSTQGLPICDYFEAQLFERRTLMCLADGCSWGETPRLAARNAVAGFMEYMKQNQHSIFDIREAGRLVLRAFSKAHQKIVEGYEDVWDAGTTTLAAGILLELDTSRTNDMTVLQAMNESLQAKHRGNHLKNIDLWQLGDHLRVAQKGSPHQQPNDEEQWFETETDKEKARNEEDKGEPFRWILVCANVGDCKIYHYDSHTHLYTDLTESSRTSLTDCRDPGGRLGPQEHPLGDPDLRNLGLLFIPCREDDLIIFLSDGVHDNLDPQNLGIMPDQLGLMHKTWLDAEVVEPQMANHYKNLFRSKYICELVKQGGTKLRCRETNAVMVAGELVEHSYEITRNSREFIETQPDGRLPMDYVRYPGKMDHSSCLVVKAGGRTAAGTTLLSFYCPNSSFASSSSCSASSSSCSLFSQCFQKYKKGREKNTPHTEHYLRYFPAFASSVKQEQQQQNEPLTSEPTETKNGI